MAEASVGRRITTLKYEAVKMVTENDPVLTAGSLNKRLLKATVLEGQNN